MHQFLQNARVAAVVYLLVTGFFLFSLPAIADEEDIFGDEIAPFGAVNSKAWQEVAVVIPARPVKDNLAKIQIFEMPRYKYYIDIASLSISAKDNVVRYTVVIETPTGIKNVFYEGIRCDTREYKLYASAINDQPLKEAFVSRWHRIGGGGVSAFRDNLFNYYLCDNSIINGKRSDIVQLLKYPPGDFIEEDATE
ncbi:MAG: hypothetical protein GXP13_05510 [Gammaproteobacteria bacterium]|nr:hypothetical protein [Gammaproteobacteria bacterium]